MSLLVPSCRWIVVWKSTSFSDEVCLEAHKPGSGRFDGLCFATFHHVISGFAAQVQDLIGPTAAAGAPLELCLNAA